MKEINLQIYRGKEKGEFRDYSVPVHPGMVVLDAIHHVQAKYDPTLAVRWNCKAGKCGSCSAEVNGKPVLTCMTRLDNFKDQKSIRVEPMKSFPVIKDLVTDVSWNYEVNKKIPPFDPIERDVDGTWRMQQKDIDRIQEFRKCIECFLCQDVCHVIRAHQQKQNFGGPRFLVRTASLAMHPLDKRDRIPFVKEHLGVGYCNITRCCTEVCPEEIVITDNAIIPLKERVVSRFYDPIYIIARKFKKIFLSA
ncbi:MAG: succinate dehydrogenase/fumarate reductase iron-sulfur subunit [Deltaproteobacteria bacterium]|nr:succinate dehydrogenase/fumarate reductase iron-sulfur subunit [Deltaproteobacteria bacterium]